MPDAQKPPKTWMPLYIGDYLADTMGLTLAQHGAYFLSMMAYWRNGGPLRDSDARSITGENAETIAKFFDLSEGVWRHKRIDAELQRASNMQAQRVQAGVASAKARWGQRESNERYNPVPTEPVTKSQRENTPSPSPLEEEKEVRGSTRKAHGQPTKKVARQDKARKGTRLPEDWTAGEREMAWAVSKGYTEAEIAKHAEAFTAHFVSGPGRNKAWTEWYRAWQQWLGKEWNAPGRLVNGHAKEPLEVKQARQLAAAIAADEALAKLKGKPDDNP